MFSDFDDVLSFAWKNLIFCGISTVVFLVKKGGVFLLSVSGIARFFPAVQLYVGWEFCINYLKSVNSMVWV